MECPQCGTAIPDEEWNCPACRINVYWARKHLAELSRLRGDEGMRRRPSTPSFLIACSKRAFGERAARGGAVDSKVREIARRTMRGEGNAEP
jgi:hypothetical protein